MTIEKFQKCFSGRLIPRPVSLECTGTELLPLKINTPLILTVHSDLYDEAAELVEKLAWKFWKWQVLVQWSQPDDSAMIPEEGYGLTVNKDAVAIRAFDLKGIRYAMNTLRQIQESERGVRESSFYSVPYCKIEDFPAMPFRGMHLCWFPETTVVDIEKQIRLAAYFKFNHIVLEPWGVFPFESEPDFCWKDKCVSRRDWQHIVNVAKELDITLIPQLNIFGHATASRVGSGKHAVLNFAPKYSSLFEEDGWCWCLSNPETRKVLTKMCLELHEFFGRPPFFHIGCDEAYTAATCSSCAKHELTELLKDHLSHFHQLFAERNTRLLLWHDMFLDRQDPRFQSGYVVSGNKELASLVGVLPKDMVFCDWEYCGCTPAQPLDFEWASSKFFMDAGYDTLLCPWENLDNNISHGHYMARHHGFGILGTTWHVNKGARTLLIMFAGTAQGAWNPLAIQKIDDFGVINNCNFAAAVRMVERDMQLTRYEEFGFLTHYQVEVDKIQNV